MIARPAAFARRRVVPAFSHVALLNSAAQIHDQPPSLKDRQADRCHAKFQGVESYGGVDAYRRGTLTCGASHASLNLV